MVQPHDDVIGMNDVVASIAGETTRIIKSPTDAGMILINGVVYTPRT